MDERNGPGTQMSVDAVEPVAITVAYGDGIGPEIMEATLRVIAAGGARLEVETIRVGEVA